MKLLNRPNKRKIVTKSLFTAFLAAASLSLCACAGSSASQTSSSGTSASSTASAGSLSDIDASEYVKLGNYKGIELTIEDTTVSDGDVEQHINSELEGIATKKEVTGRAVQDGDIVNIDYVGNKTVTLNLYKSV